MQPPVSQSTFILFSTKTLKLSTADISAIFSSVVGSPSHQKKKKKKKNYHQSDFIQLQSIDAPPTTTQGILHDKICQDISVQ